MTPKRRHKRIQEIREEETIESPSLISPSQQYESLLDESAPNSVLRSSRFILFFIFKMKLTWVIRKG